MAKPKEPAGQHGYREEITTIRGSRIWLGDFPEKNPEDRVPVVIVQTGGDSYYFVQDLRSGEYCPVHCSAFINGTEEKFRKIRAKYAGINNPALIRELIISAENEDSERVTCIVTGLMKILEAKGRVGVET